MCHFHDTCSHVETSRVKACKMVDTAMQVKSSVVQEIRKAYYGKAQAKQCHKEMRKIC
ncbi:hypothetical protein Nepgr_030264 [Nepenthes gracilis]|uniref:Uncharacterized protein n=1 Tax=Nepenthes gracilis TaxID=150966 RepID=A0AAD3TFW9_NEPGR|nr:hypothetical protein Nepgr_030264 [Nepenthes gracilis]